MTGLSIAPSRRAVTGLPLLLCAVMLCSLALIPAPAQALLPSSIWAFDADDAKSDAKRISTASLPLITRDYDVLMKGRAEPARISLTGISLVEVLKARGVDVAKVPFVKVRFGTSKLDESMALFPLVGMAESDPPPMLLAHGYKPVVGLWPSPAIVPGQFGVTPISWQQIRPIDLGGEVAVIPASEQAKIIPVTIVNKRKSNGEWLLSADVVNTDGGHLTYRWYDATGLLLSEKKRLATTDAMSGRQRRRINVVVTSSFNGSTGIDSFSYVSVNRR